MSAAFKDCHALREVYLPRSLQEIVDSAFDGTNPTFFIEKGAPLIDVMIKRGWNVHVIEPTPQKAESLDQKERLFSLPGTYCINHKMGKGDWPLLGSNGTMDLFTKRELVEEYMRQIKRKIEICFIPQAFLESYMKSWYAKGIRKIQLDNHKYEVLNISSLLGDAEFPDTIHPTLELARTLVTVKQCEEDNENFLARIIVETAQNMMINTVFLTPLRKERQKTGGIPCSSLAKEIMEKAGISTFPGLESYNIAEPSVKHEDMQSFQYEGKKVVYLFTDMNELKSFVDEDSVFGIVAYGDIAYRILHQERCGELYAGILNPGDLKCWVYG